jgi:hypothetical protein
MDEEDFSDIVSAVQLGDLDVIVDAIETKIVDAKAVDRDGCSLLHWAAINNRCEIATYLLGNGADVNAAGGVLQEIPLAWAVRKGFHSMVLLLLQAGSRVNHPNKSQMTVLHLAFKLGDLNLIFMLLHYGADPSARDRTGDSLLLWLIKARIHPELLIPYITLLRNYDVDIACTGAGASSSSAQRSVQVPPGSITSRKAGAGAAASLSVPGDSALHLLCRAFNDDTAKYSEAIEELLKCSGGSSSGRDGGSVPVIRIAAMGTDTGIREMRVDEVLFHCRNEADESPFDVRAVSPLLCCILVSVLSSICV